MIDVPPPAPGDVSATTATYIDFCHRLRAEHQAALDEVAALKAELFRLKDDLNGVELEMLDVVRDSRCLARRNAALAAELRLHDRTNALLCGGARKRG